MTWTPPPGQQLLLLLIGLGRPHLLPACVRVCVRVRVCTCVHVRVCVVCVCAHNGVCACLCVCVLVYVDSRRDEIVILCILCSLNRIKLVVTSKGQ